jgi:hypothetical protein
MRDHLHGRAQIIAAPFLGDDCLVDAPLGDVVGLAGRDAGEALIMAEVEVGFGAVIRHIDFAMLIGRHRAGIDIQIGIELANAHTISTRLQQCCKGGGHKAFAKRGDHAAGDENNRAMGVEA